MSQPKITAVFAATLLALSASQAAFAQSSVQNPALEQSRPAQNTTSRRIVRKEVQPVAYWVEAASLNLRDNPVAGKVIGNLDYGQKVLAYDQYENWIRVSKSDAKEQWVNSDFLSNSRISWASYSRPKASLQSDFVPVRIKDPEDRKKRMFGVRLKKSETDNALITTQQYTAQGIFYQNRFVSCKKEKVIGVRLIGEGSNFLRAQNDVRNLGKDIYDVEQIDDKANNSAESAIASFACKTKAF